MNANSNSYSVLWDDKKWDNSIDDDVNNFNDINEMSNDYRIKIDKSINKLIHFQLSDMKNTLKLPSDCIIIGQNESLSDNHEGNDLLRTIAGPKIDYEIPGKLPVLTGSAAITTSGNLHYQAIIHAVGPKYDKRYEYACDYSLHAAYKSALTLAYQSQFKSIIICCIYKKHKNYPRFDAAHVALRTIRKFLEKTSINDLETFNGFERIMLCLPTQDDYEIYSTLLTAYFPRNVNDLLSQDNLLPMDIGDEWGEIKPRDRTISITPGPKPFDESKRQRNSNENIKPGENMIKPDWPRPRSMTDVIDNEDDLRQQRVKDELSALSKQEFLTLKYANLAEQEFNENVDDLVEHDFFTIVGKDRYNNTVIFFTQHNLINVVRQQQRVYKFIILTMEKLRCMPYSIVFAYSGCSIEDKYIIPNEFITSIFEIITTRYNENFQQFYILHASMLMRLSIFSNLPLPSSTFWRGYIDSPSLKSLNKYMEISQLNLPRKVKIVDKKMNPDDYIMSTIET